MFTADAQGWTDALNGSSVSVPLTVVALTSTSGEGRSAVELFEVGVRGAVVVRPDGHVVWRSRIGPSEVDRLRTFLVRRWESVYPDIPAGVNLYSVKAEGR